MCYSPPCKGKLRNRVIKIILERKTILVILYNHSTKANCTEFYDHGIYRVRTTLNKIYKITCSLLLDNSSLILTVSVSGLYLCCPECILWRCQPQSIGKEGRYSYPPLLTTWGIVITYSSLNNTCISSLNAFMNL